MNLAGRAVFLAIGSNIEPARHLERIVDALSELGDLALGRVVELDPVGLAGGRFLNTVARLDTPLDPPALKRALNAIEAALGRPRWQPDAAMRPRTADIDVLFDAADVPPDDALPAAPYIGPMLRELLAALGHPVPAPAPPPGHCLSWRGRPFGDRPRRLRHGPAGPETPPIAD